MLLVFAQTTTTEVQRVVGDPLAAWIPWTAGIVLLVVILLVGRWLSRRAGSPRTAADAGTDFVRD